jgi:hypothetical protein
VYHHPTLLQALADDRVAERRLSAAASAHIRRDSHARKLVAAARHAAGWLLVDMGLWLATPRRRRNHSVAGARR